MSCCGKQSNPGKGMSVSWSWGAPPPDLFEYVGATGMTVQGGATGQIYRFGHPGARVAVDPRDTRTMLSVPRLRRL